MPIKRRKVEKMKNNYADFYKDTNELKKIIEGDDLLIEKLAFLIDRYKFNCDEIESVEIKGDSLNIEYTIWDSGDTYHYDTTIPVSWLSLDEETLSDEIIKRREQDEIEAKRQREAQEKEYEELRKKREYEEYLKLKEKYEKEEN